ncbi:MAG TPA: hypothetical protein DEP84_06870 [Chloroflexi bacterium]|nr:hypothetical protein [Chloroflexota bacterium]
MRINLFFQYFSFFMGYVFGFHPHPRARGSLREILKEAPRAGFPLRDVGLGENFLQMKDGGG